MKLDSKDKYIYQKIKFFTESKANGVYGYCDICNESFAKQLGLTKESVSRRLSKLLKYAIIKNIGNKQYRKLVVGDIIPDFMNIYENDSNIIENDRKIIDNDNNIIENDVLMLNLSIKFDKHVIEKMTNLSLENDFPVKQIIRENIKILNNIFIKEKKEKFIAPTIEEVVEYAQSRKCTEETAQKFFDYYSTQGWKDSKGNKVKNWKGKFIAIWDKPENHETPFYI